MAAGGEVEACRPSLYLAAARQIRPRLKSGVFRWASGIHSFMLRERIETPRRLRNP